MTSAMTELLLAALVAAAGSCLQGAVGFGVNLIATPLLLLIDDVYVPAPVILASFVLNLLIARREHRGSVDPRIGGAIAGQLVGAVAAGAVLASVPTRSLSLLFAGCVLAAVALSASGLHLSPTPRTLAGTGLASGFMGTLSGIGGPPIALVYQHAEGPVLRATLARFFLVGTVVSVPTLIVVGELAVDELVATAALLPGVIVGFAASKPLVRHIDRRSVRPFVLGLSAAAAVAVLVRKLL
jgi:uncharacterized membrane protein YfcA